MFLPGRERVSTAAAAQSIHMQKNVFAVSFRCTAQYNREAMETTTGTKQHCEPHDPSEKRIEPQRISANK